MLVNVGNIINSYAYSPFGELIVEQEEVKLNIGFNTKYEDASGLIYYNNRYYDSDLGRFISQDAIFEEGGVNLYNFVENDPINHWDILGNRTTVSIGSSTAYAFAGNNDPVNNQNLKDQLGSLSNIATALSITTTWVTGGMTSALGEVLATGLSSTFPSNSLDYDVLVANLQHLYTGHSTLYSYRIIIEYTTTVYYDDPQGNEQVYSTDTETMNTLVSGFDGGAAISSLANAVNRANDRLGFELNSINSVANNAPNITLSL